MKVTRSYFPSLLIFFSFLFHIPSIDAAKSYVVYLGGIDHDDLGTSLTTEEAHEARTQSHYSFLGSIMGDEEKAKHAIFYSYTGFVNGFAATLNDEEVAKISGVDNAIVIPNTPYKLHTTRSWEFLGQERNGIALSDSLMKKARFGEDSIIANLDTGVWSQSESFNDVGMGPIPARWKGKCDPGVHCNKKLIGARHFVKGYVAAMGYLDPAFNATFDTDGHGTHTLSTAGGRAVPDVSIFGRGNGTAMGGSPNARVAPYKVCWPTKDDSGGCFSADILAAFDQAIIDGVDVISASLGGDDGPFYFEDMMAIGAFHATMKGVSVVMSAGNSGPKVSSITNVAPWIFTIGANTMDREFTSVLALGNKVHIKGQSLSVKTIRTFLPMISAADAALPTNTSENAELCLDGTLDPTMVKGKVVVCLRGNNGRAEKGYVVLKAGGAAMVLANDKTSGDELIADAHVLPATHITYSDGLTVFAYLNSTKSPYAYLTSPRTNLGVKPSPVMASFSSQGPNPVTPEILKPDITAPGVSVLAAYSGEASPSAVKEDTRRVPYNTESGTSMSCPHVAGIVGLMKTLYPHWSPAAIKSAIMTTATTRDNLGEPIKNGSLVTATPFSYGAGHVNPNGAMDPGLVYDLTPTDYLNFMCALGYSSSQIALISSKTYKCPSTIVKPEDLNYPTITIPNLIGSTKVTRVLKNVGSPGTYKVFVKAPRGVSVSVYPKTLTFEKEGDEKKFEVTIKANKSAVRDYVFGTLRWSDKNGHHVKSAIVVKGSN